MEVNKCKYSVLMSVYANDNPDCLRQTVENMLCQTTLPEQIVMMVDGAVSKELKNVISEYENNRKLFTVVWLAENGSSVETVDQREKTLLGALISDMVMAFVNYASESKRMHTKQKQAEGIAAARQKGIKFGRPQVPLPDNFYEVQQQWRQKKLTLRQAANACGLATTTFYNKVKAMERESKAL